VTIDDVRELGLAWSEAQQRVLAAAAIDDDEELVAALECANMAERAAWEAMEQFKREQETP
jgi:hypothetical protein